jgi:hypothetical protein
LHRPPRAARRLRLRPLQLLDGCIDHLSTLDDCAFDLYSCSMAAFRPRDARGLRLRPLRLLDGCDLTSRRSGTAPSTTLTARCAIKLLHVVRIRLLILDNTLRHLRSILLGLFLTLLQVFYGIFQQARGLHGYMSSERRHLFFRHMGTCRLNDDIYAWIHGYTWKIF